MIQNEIVYQAKERFNSDILETNSDEIRVQCPYCRDSGRTYEDYKLYINTVTGKYWCHRCHSSGVISRTGVTATSTADVYDIINSISGTNDTKKLFKLPSKLVSEVESSYRYTLDRGISDKDIYYYSIRVSSLSDSNLLSGRIVIPNEVINFDYTDMYSARSYIGSEKRYLNSYGSHANSIVFNLHRIKMNISRLIINEGPINSIISGHNSVALYGKYASPQKVKSILNKYPKEIIISLDRDAIDDSYKLAQVIKEANSSINVRIVELPLGEDASSLGYEEYMKYVESSVIYKSRLNYWLSRYVGNNIKGDKI